MEVCLLVSLWCVIERNVREDFLASPPLVFSNSFLHFILNEQ